MLKRLLAWLRRLFGLAETRQTLRLGDGTGAARTAGQVGEQVRRKGPLKPGHQRLIVRDERLMPKAPRSAGWTKPPKVMTAADATRLFAGTLRTKSRELRTLDCDLAQLTRLGLPSWRTEADVARALGLSVGQLRHYATHRQRERVSHYVVFSVPRRKGGARLIHAPKKKLKEVLRRLDGLLVSKLPVSEHAHGFRKGRSVKTGAEPHVGKAVVLRLDLKDFFPHVTHARVRGLLIAAGYGYPVAATLAVLVTEAARQPVEVDGQVFQVPVGPRHCVQGAPTSPGLCNAILLKLDRRLAGAARKHGFSYTRYADDLTFSGPDVREAHRLRRQVGRLVREEGFVLNAPKTRVMGKGARQLVTGVTVNQVLGLSRIERRRIRAMLHRAKVQGADPRRQAELKGLLAWVQMLNPAQADALRRRAGLGQPRRTPSP